MNFNIIQRKKTDKKDKFWKKIQKNFNYYKTGYIAYNYYAKKNIM